MLRGPALALVLCAIFPLTALGHSCRCLYGGGLVAQGETVCIKTAKGYRLARCEMFLNNSTWKFLDQPCDRLQSQNSTGPKKSG
jgi:hypothetical protein